MRDPRRPRETGRDGIMRAVTDLLTAERVRWYRMNSSMTVLAGANGKRRVIRGHKTGTPDILMHIKMRVALPDPLDIPGGTMGNGIQWCEHGLTMAVVSPVWIECKAPGGRLTNEQHDFYREAWANSETVLVISDASDLATWLKANRA